MTRGGGGGTGGAWGKVEEGEVWKHGRMLTKDKASSEAFCFPQTSAC